MNHLFFQREKRVASRSAGDTPHTPSMSCSTVGPARPTIWIAYHKTGWVNSMDLISFVNNSYIERAAVVHEWNSPPWHVASHLEWSRRTIIGNPNNSTGAPLKRRFLIPSGP